MKGGLGTEKSLIDTGNHDHKNDHNAKIFDHKNDLIDKNHEHKVKDDQLIIFLMEIT